MRDHEQRPPDETSDKSPLTSATLARAVFDVAGSGKPPEELRTLELLPRLRPFSHNVIDREKLIDVRTDPTDAFRPEWCSSSVRPRRAMPQPQAKRTLWHHGAEMEPLFIWNPDDRKPYNDTTYPWGCVCKVLTATGSGSGVIVGPRHVLTASHVIDWSSAAGTVEVHRAGPAVSAITAIEAVWYYTKVTGSTVGYSEVDEDYAVIITADRIGDLFGWLGTRTYNSSWDDEDYWWNIGYPGDVANQDWPIFQPWKALDEDEWDWGPARSMTTTADTWKGQSGSPLFGFWDDGPYVVSVVSAHGTFFLSGDENWCAGGSYLTKLVRHARQEDA